MLQTVSLINKPKNSKRAFSNTNYSFRDTPEKYIAFLKINKIVNSDKISSKQPSGIQLNEGNSQLSTDSTVFTSTEQLRVLVVEDNLIAQDFHKKMLMDMGCLVHTAENAAEAMAILLHNSYDLILLDICLPGKNGYELAVEIRKMQEIKPMIAAVTINTDKNVKVQCDAAGIDQVFCKPLNREKINLILGNISNVKKNRVLNLYSEQVLLDYYAVAIKNAPKPDGMSKSQYFNYLAIQLLEEMGNKFPTQVAIDCVESFIKRLNRRNN
ncbi:MAG TPA: response regulator [Patescibacteria group bacterium]|nr:response regulator [Gammaproteobacteria bacterium]HWA51533.1 response regulator [Patescibacteria group bacterium]